MGISDAMMQFFAVDARQMHKALVDFKVLEKNTGGQNAGQNCKGGQNSGHL